MTKLEELREALDREDILESRLKFEERYSQAIRIEDVRRILKIDTPKITNLTDILNIKNGGRLDAIRMDLNEGVDNHKKQFFSFIA